MNFCFLLAVIVACSISISNTSGADREISSPIPLSDSKCFELRTYYAAPGKLDDLNARFRHHTTKIFQKHGMQNIGYWLPAENPDNKLIYLLGFSSREAATRAWKDLGADPECQRVQKHSE